MLNRKIVNVTAEDIQKGTRKSADTCMIARALGRELKSKSHFSVSPEAIIQTSCEILSSRCESGTISFQLGWNRRRFHVDDRIKNRIKAFDRLEKVEPFQILLEWDDENSDLNKASVVDASVPEAQPSHGSLQLV